MSVITERRCPACEAEEPGELFVSCSDFAYLDRLKQFYADGTFSYLRCAGCGTVYVNELAPTTELGAAYADEGAQTVWIRAVKQDVSSIKKRLVHRFYTATNLENVTLGRILKRTRSRERLLDIGCGAGTFMRLCGRHFARVEGVEPNPVTAQHTRETTGFDVYEKPVEQLALPSDTYDVITMNQVIEHLREPLEVVREAARLLRPGGILYLACPNGDSVSLNLLKGKHIHLGMHHVSLFTPKSLSVLCERAGLRTLVAQAEILDLTPMDVIKFKLSPGTFKHRIHPAYDRIFRHLCNRYLGGLFAKSGSYSWGMFRK